MAKKAMARRRTRPDDEGMQGAVGRERESEACEEWDGGDVCCGRRHHSKQFLR